MIAKRATGRWKGKRFEFMNKADQFRRKIEEGKLVKGVFITMPEASASEMAGYAGYDYVWIDAEHGAMDRQEIYHHIMAAQGAGCAAFVRVREAVPSIVKAILDMGPDGIIFPFCNNAEIVQKAVASCSYPDDAYHGIRGQGPVRAIKYGLDDEEVYLKEAYSKVIKIAQIETYEGYQNLDEILAVEGIDSLFIGMADMSRSLAGTPGSPKPESVFTDICGRTRVAGRMIGCAIGAVRGEAMRVVEHGVQWVVFGQDSRILAEGLRANLEAVSSI